MSEDATEAQQRVGALGERLAERVTQATGGRAVCRGTWGYLDAHGWKTTADAGAYVLSCHRQDIDQPFAIYCLAPWQPLFSDSAGLQMPAMLVTVTEEAVVLAPPAGDISEEAAQLRGEVEKAAAEVLALEANQAVLNESLDEQTPDGLVVLSTRARRHYITVQVAVPGSRLPTHAELARALARDRILEMVLVPDIGSTQHFLLPPTWAELEGERAAPPEAERAAPPAMAPVQAPVAAPADLQPLPSSATPPFGDYQPKRSPDTALDFRSSLARDFEALPPAEAASLPELLHLLEAQQQKARKSPGTFVDGNVILGAPPREFQPSDEELVESELGDRVARAAAAAPAAEVEAILKRANITLRSISYRAITIEHVDVMGSGRFFYASEPVQREVTLGAR